MSATRKASRAAKREANKAPPEPTHNRWTGRPLLFPPKKPVKTFAPKEHKFKKKPVPEDILRLRKILKKDPKSVVRVILENREDE